jgi:MFS family permease
LIFAPFAGVLVDRWDRQRILLITQVLSLLQSLALGLLTLGRWITVREIIALQIMQGVINAFDTPARQAFVVDMVEDRTDLPNAIALNSSMVNASRIVGPSIGGAVIAAVGEGWCFMLDAVSYLFVIGSLLAMQLRHATLKRDTRVGAELRGGFEYVARSIPIRTALIVLAIVSAMGMPYVVLMPAIAAEVLHGGPNTLGMLMAATGVGALAGALYLAGRKSVVGLGRVTMYATLTFGAGLVAFAFARHLPVAIAILVVVGAGFMVQMAATNTVLQTLVDDAMRGRVMAFYTMAFLGTAPIGSLFAGYVAQRVGTTITIAIGGAACLMSGAWLAVRLPVLRTIVRPIYIQRGILQAVETATAEP